jgi:hypothetical protein
MDSRYVAPALEPGACAADIMEATRVAREGGSGQELSPERGRGGHGQECLSISFRGALLMVRARSVDSQF